MSTSMSHLAGRESSLGINELFNLPPLVLNTRRLISDSRSANCKRFFLGGCLSRCWHGWNTPKFRTDYDDK